MSWRNGQAYGQDLRDRVLAMPGVLREVAERFGVSQAYVCRARARRQRLAQTGAGAQHNHRPLRWRPRCASTSVQRPRRRCASCASGRAARTASGSSQKTENKAR